MKVFIRIIALLCVFSLGACSQSQTFAPKAKQSELVLQGQSFETISAPKYIGILENSGLEQYLRQVLENNHDLKSLAATIQTYKLREKIIDARPLPEADIGLTGQRDKNIETINTQDSTNISLNISWAVDIWGKLADESKAARLETQQQTLLYQHARMALLAQAVQTWLSLWSYQNQLNILEQRITIAQNSTETIENYYQNGQASYSQLTQRRTTADLLQQEQTQIEALMRIQLHKLNILRGELPNHPMELSQSSIIPVVAMLPNQISALTLLERPDIQAAFKQIEILDAQTTAANKALLPQLTISANLGKSGKSFSRVFTGDLLWQLVGGLTQPLFNGGQLKNEAKRISKQSEIAFYRYEQTILKAMEEVENGLANESAMLEQMSLTEQRLDEMKKQLVSVQQMYQAGAIGVLPYFDVQEQLLAVRKEWIEIQTSYLSNRVLLALALGQSHSSQSLAGNGD